MLAWYYVLIITILCLIGGLVLGFFGARYYFKKQLEKNPPIDEKTIRLILMQTGQKPSESRIRSIMNSINKKKF